MTESLLENSKVKITTFITAGLLLLGAIGGVVGFAISESAWRTNMSRDISDLKVSLQNLDNKIVGKGPNSWHKRDMKLFASELQAKNPDLKVPEPENGFE
jgi:hypothetical protein